MRATHPLGISRVTLSKKMQKYGLMPPARGRLAGTSELSAS